MSTMEGDIKSCHHCPERFTSKTSWKDHMLKSHNVLAYTCDLCPKTFFGQTDFIQHFDSEHKSDCNRHICTYCGVSYKWFKFLNKHIRDKHQIEKLMQCADCGEEFYNSVAFKKHLRLKHSGGWRFHKCSKCHRSFTAKELVVLHDKFDHSRNGDQHFKEYAETHLTNLEDESLLESSKKCVKCNLQFSSSIYLMKHLKSTHNKQKYFRCCKCDDAFYNTRAGLSVHLYYEHGVPREHKCNKCRYGHTKTFVNKIRKNKENMSKDRSMDEPEAELPYWAKSFVKGDLPSSMDLVGATDNEISNLRANIKSLFQVLSTVPPSKLRGNTVVDPYLQFYSARKKLSDDLRRDCRRRDERNNIVNGNSPPTPEIQRPKRKLKVKRSSSGAETSDADTKKEDKGLIDRSTLRKKDSDAVPKLDKSINSHEINLNVDVKKDVTTNKYTIKNKTPRSKRDKSYEKAEKDDGNVGKMNGFVSDRPRRNVDSVGKKDKSPDVKAKDIVKEKVENQRPTRSKDRSADRVGEASNPKIIARKEENIITAEKTPSRDTKKTNKDSPKISPTSARKSKAIGEEANKSVNGIGKSDINSQSALKRKLDKSSNGNADQSNKKSKIIPNGMVKDTNDSSSVDNTRPKRNKISHMSNAEKNNEKSPKINSEKQKRVTKSIATDNQYTTNDDNKRQTRKRTRQEAQLHSNVNKKPEIFKCNECQSEFKIKKDIVKHLETHNTETASPEKADDSALSNESILAVNYKCDLCKTEFKDELLLLNHLTECHSSGDFNVVTEQVYKCIECGDGFRDKDALNVHMKTHSNNECSICKKTFKDEKGLRLHKMRAHSEKIYKCDKCKIEFTNARELTKHTCGGHEDFPKDEGGNSDSPVHVNKENVETLDERKPNHRLSNPLNKKGEPKRLFKCLKCDFKFLNREILLAHIQQAHKVAVNKVFKCDKCIAVFKMADKLKQHVILKHSWTEKKLPVIRIKKSKLSTVTLQNAGKIDLLNSLISNTLNKSMHNCKICFSYFPSRELLQRHIQWEHTKNVNLHKCGQCGHVLYSVEDLEMHMHSTHSIDTIVKWKKQIANTYVKQTDVCEAE